jgi:alkylated DNA repair dioxygenase AlkB
MLPGNIFNSDLDNLLPQDGSLVYIRNFLTLDEEHHYFDKLKSEINWRSDQIKMFGKIHDLPRLQAWYGDKAYSYSGIHLHPEPWTDSLLELKEKSQLVAKSEFNSLLLNYYRSGNDHVSWHADDEAELGSKPMIASISLGNVRKFQLRHKYEKMAPLSIEVEPGSLILMSGDIQEFWNHRIAKTSKDVGERINLTFRHISVSPANSA